MALIPLRDIGIILPHTPSNSPARTEGTPSNTPTSIYSDRLKAACAEGAEDRRPPCPAFCCFCGHVRVFTQLTYKVTNAGKWCAVVSTAHLAAPGTCSTNSQCPSCNRTWFPEQTLPPAAQLAHIEAIRAKDKLTVRDHKVAVAAQRAWDKEVSISPAARLDRCVMCMRQTTRALRVQGGGGGKMKNKGKGKKAAANTGGKPLGSSQVSNANQRLCPFPAHPCGRLPLSRALPPQKVRGWGARVPLSRALPPQKDRGRGARVPTRGWALEVAQTPSARVDQIRTTREVLRSTRTLRKDGFNWFYG